MIEYFSDYDDDEAFRTQLKIGKKLITLKEASKIYSISINTLYKWSSQGKLGKYKIGKRVYISPPEFEGWIENFYVGPGWG
jgi:excisionase family DNA binding protein